MAEKVTSLSGGHIEQILPALTFGNRADGSDNLMCEPQIVDNGGCKRTHSWTRSSWAAELAFSIWASFDKVELRSFPHVRLQLRPQTSALECPGISWWIRRRFLAKSANSIDCCHAKK
jgi:hypothetical protein